MIKPCTGYTPEVGAKLFFEAAAGGVDIIKDDELIGGDREFIRLRIVLKPTWKQQEKLRKSKASLHYMLAILRMCIKIKRKCHESYQKRW